MNPQEVLATANAFLAQLAPDAADDAVTQAAKAARVAQFINHALPPTFVADLQAQVAAIGTLKDEHEAGREKSVGATYAIQNLVCDGRKQVNHLDAVARNLYKNNPEQLRAWISASHIERDPVHASSTPAPTPPATTK